MRGIVDRRPMPNVSAVQAVSVWTVLAVVNGLAFALPDSRFFGLSSAVMIASVALLNLMTFLALGERHVGSRHDMSWLSIFLLVAGYLVIRTAFAFVFEEPVSIGDFNLDSGLKLWRGNVSWLFYTASLWLVLCGSDSQFSLKTFVRAWFVLNFVYYLWTLVFGFEPSAVHAFDMHSVTTRLTLLGYEPSYTGPMLIIMAMLLLAQKPLRLLDWLLLLLSIVAFFAVFSKGAVVAFILAAVVTLALHARALIRAVSRHYLIAAAMVIVVSGAVFLVFKGTQASAFASNVITPLLLGPEKALGYARSGQASSFSSRYLAMIGSASVVWPGHLLFGFGDGIYHFPLVQAAIHNGFLTPELSSYVSGDLGAFTAKSDALNLLLKSGAIGLVGALILMIRSFRFTRTGGLARTMRSERCFLFVFMAIVLVLTERLPYWSIFLMVNFSYGRLGTLYARSP